MPQSRYRTYSPSPKTCSCPFIVHHFFHLCPQEVTINLFSVTTVSFVFSRIVCHGIIQYIVFWSGFSQSAYFSDSSMWLYVSVVCSFALLSGISNVINISCLIHSPGDSHWVISSLWQLGCLNKASMNILVGV